MTASEIQALQASCGAVRVVPELTFEYVAAGRRVLSQSA
jgi:hypothetical protein